MSYYDEDYYQEPSEFDQMIDEFKAKLSEAVKEETQIELAKLRAENVELRDKVKNLDRLERQVAVVKREYETRAKSAEYEAKTEYNKKKFSELIKQLTDPKYVVSCTWSTGEKCDECDANRYIKFTSPQGRDASARCQCADSLRVYEVREECVVEVQKSRQYGQPEFNLWYEARPVDRYGDDDYLRSRWVLKPEDLTQEELVRKYSEVGFDSKEEAQKLADVLNAKEATNA